jgi:SAM-dependent methyltransferase
MVKLPPLTFNAWLRYDIVRRRLAGLEDIRSILEIGAGEGALGARLAVDYDYTGLEPDERSFRRAEARLATIGRGRIICGDLSSLEPGQMFDVACAFEVLEHIEDDEAALRAWRERLRPRGYLLLSVPAFPRQWGAADVKAGHFRRYEPQHLANLLRSAGFDSAAIDRYGFPLGYLLQAGRNLIARRESAPGSLEAATAASGRWLQPPEPLGWATQALTWPFRHLQRPFIASSFGTGLVALASRAP